MSPVAFLRNALRVLVPLAVAFTVYLYLYPVFLGCAFPLPEPPAGHPDRSDRAAFQETLRQHVATSDSVAPFRLLALGDPQLEGDTSIRNYNRPSFPHLTNAFHQLSSTRPSSIREPLKQAFHDLVDFYFDDIPNTAESVRKRIDLFGNDFYLAHIYHVLSWWAKPTHVSVLGDLLGSQWIKAPEFERRSSRFWKRSFRGGERVPDEVAAYPSEEYDLAGLLGVEDENAAAWRRRIINVAGNHDIGYAGDLTKGRLERFERVFGKAAYELRFELPITDPIANDTIFDPHSNPTSDRLVPELRILNVNNMNLDTPAVDQSLQDKTYAFMNDVINTASSVEYKGHFTLVLTHIPLYKPEGVCVDAPFFTFHASGGVKEQNQLSADASKGFLEGIFGLNGDPNAPGHGRGRRGVVLNGHDHEGCDTYHYINQTLSGEERQWQVARWPAARDDQLPGKPGLPGLREITVRAMMGEFGGNAGLLSVWFDQDTWEWKFEFNTCPLGRQYFWWFVHVYDLIIFVIALGYGALQTAIGAGFDLDRWPGSKSSKRAVEEASTSATVESTAEKPEPAANGSTKKI
ncbi:hypothetical protein F5Y15DRAFT_285363 [Xylariaceae sp. FL0016]|nr:hypothetical protein F5Y15DRAFT_285363 [Xylariaceae sp. FL0016]